VHLTQIHSICILLQKAIFLRGGGFKGGALGAEALPSKILLYEQGRKLLDVVAKA